MKEVSSEAERECRQALSLMEDALSILDRSDCALDVAAHLDLAICRLREALDFPAPIISMSRIGSPSTPWPIAGRGSPGQGGRRR